MNLQLFTRLIAGSAIVIALIALAFEPSFPLPEIALGLASVALAMSKFSDRICLALYSRFSRLRPLPPMPEQDDDAWIPFLLDPFTQFYGPVCRAWHIEELCPHRSCWQIMASPLTPTIGGQDACA